MKRCFRRFRDERFALTTLRNPLIEVRTHAELVAAAQREREHQLAAAEIPATHAPAALVAASAPDSSEPLPAVLASLDSLNEEAKQPAPKPRRKAKTKSRHRSNPGRSPASPEYQDLDQDESPEPTAAERHARKRSICRPPQREYIEGAFQQWRSP
jgi:hypothetical protein